MPCPGSSTSSSPSGSPTASCSPVARRSSGRIGDSRARWAVTAVQPRKTAQSMAGRPIMRVRRSAVGLAEIDPVHRRTGFRPWIGFQVSTGRDASRRPGSGPAMVEVLEARQLLADGITPGGRCAHHRRWPACRSPTRSSRPIPSPASHRAQPGTQWRAKITFGDGQVEKNVVPIQVGSHVRVPGHAHLRDGGQLHRDRDDRRARVAQAER